MRLEFLDNLHVLQSLAIDDFPSFDPEKFVRSSSLIFQSLHQLTLGEDLRQKSSTRNLLPLASDSLLDGPAQMVHDVSWKVNPVEGGQEVKNQFVINTGLVRPSSFLKKAFR